MSKSRSIKTHFWNDTFIGELEPEEKLLYIYLITNPLTNMLGVYEIQIRRICFDTKLSLETVTEGLETLKKDKKADYVDGYIILANFVRNQNYNTNMLKSAVSDMEELPLSVLKTPIFGRVMEWFRRVPDRYEMVRNIEVEVEGEKEVEEEDIYVSTSGSDEFPGVCEYLDEATELAEHLLTQITQWKPDHKYASRRPSLKSWVLDIERMIRIDARDPEKIRGLIDYTFTKKTRQSQFWAKNIWSGSALRDKYDRLVSDYKDEHNQNSNGKIDIKAINDDIDEILAGRKAASETTGSDGEG